MQCRIPPQSGIALELQRGQTLRVIDPFGEQVSDVVAFWADDPDEVLSSGRTLDYNGTIRLTTGHVLYSNRGRPVFTLGEDTVGRHDFLLAPCSPEMFALLHGIEGDHPSCFGNLSQRLGQYGIGPDAIPTAFNVFMHVDVGPDGKIDVLPPLSRPGDHLDLRAEMDLIVAVTACSAEQSNNGAFKPIDVEILG